MNDILGDPKKSLLLGLAISVAILIAWMAVAGVDRIGLLSFLLRWTHVFSAIIWVGMIWFVNFIQFAAIRDADDAGKAAIHKFIVPKVALTFRHTSHAVLLTGILLLITSGYLLDRLVFTSAVYVPPLRNALLWSGTLAGFAMWAFVHFKIWPNIKVVLGETPGDADAKMRARDSVRIYARLNLILSVPVTFVMIAAAHLY